MSTLDDIAPFPRVANITARSVSTHYAAFALLHHTIAMNCDLGRDRETYNRSSNMAILAFGLAHVLRAFADVPGKGDQAALELFLDMGDPSSFGEWLHEWLADADVSPEAVIAIAGQATALNPAAPAQKEGAK